MKKDKYPLTAGGLLPGGPGGMVDPSGRIGGPGSITSSQGGAAAAAAAARDMYSSMNGYMPNGYHSAYAAASSETPIRFMVNHHTAIQVLLHSTVDMTLLLTCPPT